MRMRYNANSVSSHPFEDMTTRDTKALTENTTRRLPETTKGNRRRREFQRVRRSIRRTQTIEISREETVLEEQWVRSDE